MSDVFFLNTPLDKKYDFKLKYTSYENVRYFKQYITFSYDVYLSLKFSLWQASLCFSLSGLVKCVTLLHVKIRKKGIFHDYFQNQVKNIVLIEIFYTLNYINYHLVKKISS